MPVPFSIGTKTSGGSEEGDDTGKKQDYFHVWFVSISGGRYAMGADFSMGCNPYVQNAVSALQTQAPAPSKVNYDECSSRLLFQPSNFILPPPNPLALVLKV
jgi:hypothetical protein